MLYTTYHANLKNLTDIQKEQVIIISRGANFKGFKKDWDLCPSSELLKAIKSNDITFEEFRCRFEEQMATGKTFEALNKLYLRIKEHGEDIILSCYEKDSNLCHRKIIADAFIANGIDSKELEIGGK